MRKFRFPGAASAVGMAALCGLAACTAVAESVRDLASYVDPFIGTAGTANCHPDACCPHGMVQAGPSSGTAQWKYCGGYQFEDRMLYGFVQNAICGTGVPALGDIRLQPFVGEGENEERTAEKADEKASPGYYAVSYPKQGIRTEVAASPHVAFYTFTFGEKDAARMLVDLQWGHCSTKDFLTHVLSCETSFPDEFTMTGRRHVRRWVERDCYFAIKFSRPVVARKTLPKKDPRERGERVELDFGTSAKGPLMAKVALSRTSVAAALANMESEIPHWDFSRTAKEARDAWNAVLSRCEIEGTDEQKTTFYTSMYHLFIAPNDISDVGEPAFYSTLSLWDTFRAAHPLYTILAPEKAAEFVDSMLEQGRRTGYLPIWTLWGRENQCMIGTHSVPVIVDWFLKEVGENSSSSRKDGSIPFSKSNSELQLKTPTQNSNSNSYSYWLSAYAQIKDTLTKPHEKRKKERWDLLDKYGYYPFDLIKGESVSRTLECAYDDWCAGVMAEKMGEWGTGDEELDKRLKADAAFFFRRSQNWKNVFDPSIGFMRGRDTRGRWREPFNPFALGHGAAKANDFTEGNAFQYTWHVLHDPQGLIDAFGGCGKFAAALDSLFRQPESVEGMGKVLDVTGLIGQYAHGNEPSHHVAYFYQFAGRPDRTAEVVREVCDKFYLNAPDGLSGNDDCGQMSAWYVFSAMGFYPFNPCGGEYVLGAPQVERVTIKLERLVGERKNKYHSPTQNSNSNSFTIIAKNLSRENKYVKSVTLNGRPLDGFVIRHSDIMAGGELVFEMTDSAGIRKAGELEEGFASPPKDRHPEIWLFRFGSGTPDSIITHDLERLASVGIAGVMVYGFDSTDERPYGRLALDARPEAVKKFRWALREAHRLGMTVRLCIGPAGCGNERMSPDNAQKSLVFATADVDGGRKVLARLPKGKVDMPKRCVWRRDRMDFDWPLRHWRDIRVMAVPIREGGARADELLDVSVHFDATTEELEWDAPPGRWRIVRAAWVPLKLGWVDFYLDPLSREAFDEHWAHVVQPILDAATPEERAAFKGVMCDSWEAGEVGWTQKFPDEFRSRRGYDVWPVLAAKAGAEMSGRDLMLRDFDETISELFAENHYAYQKEVANRHGLESEAEACGPHQSMGDMRRMQGRCDLMTGEFWMPCPHRSTPQQRFMLRDSATAAHVYGAGDVRAESFTTMGTHWQESPAMLKPCVDRAFCDGLTRVVWHGMLMSDPVDELPGATRRAGAYYSPKVTWFPQSGPLNQYFARCSWMLSRGRFAADCLLYMGDAFGLYIGLKTPGDALGPGYDYDVCPTELLLKARVENGEIVLPSGMRYKVLYLSDKNPKSVDPSPRSTRPAVDAPYAWPIPPEAHAKIGELEAAGATVLRTRSARDAWVAEGSVPPDFACDAPEGSVDWIHRTSPEVDVYFVSNQGNAENRFAATFRQPICRVELWDAVTGGRRAASSADVGRGCAKVDLSLAPGGSVFAVFYKGEKASAPVEGKPQVPGVVPLDSGWRMTFDPKWGGPEGQVAFSELCDWTLNADSRIRFYSGTATYRVDFDLPDGFRLEGAEIDLGSVRDVAEVSLNGRSLGVLWTPPFKVRADGLGRRGNVLEVKVTNLWANRLIGDSALPAGERVAKTDRNPFSPDSPLMPSGLLGPVCLLFGP